MKHRLSAHRLDCQHLEVAERNKEIWSRIQSTSSPLPNDYRERREYVGTRYKPAESLA